MRRAIRFAVPLVAGLALVTWAASVIVNQTTRAWFDRDINLRAQLAVSGARQALISHWHKERRSELLSVLGEITRDERIMAAAACGADGTLLTKTRDYPTQLGCSDLGARLQAVADPPGGGERSWTSVQMLPGGQVHVSAIPVLGADHALGFVVLVHDLSFVERREATTDRKSVV